LDLTGIEISTAVNPDFATNGVDSTGGLSALQIEWVVVKWRDIALSAACWWNALAGWDIETGTFVSASKACGKWVQILNGLSLAARRLALAGRVAPGPRTVAILWEASATASLGVEELNSCFAQSLVLAWSAAAAVVVEKFASWAFLLHADASAHSDVPLVVGWASLDVAEAHARFRRKVVGVTLAVNWSQFKIANFDVENQFWVGRALVSAEAFLVGDGPVLWVSVDIWAAAFWGLLFLDTVGHVEVVVSRGWLLVVASAAAWVGIEEVFDSINCLLAIGVELTLASAVNRVPNEARLALLWEASALSFVEVEVESDGAVAVLWVSEAWASSGIPVLVIRAFIRWGADARAGFVVEVLTLWARTVVVTFAFAGFVVKSSGDSIDRKAFHWRA
jgi:hypothetical protein